MEEASLSTTFKNNINYDYKLNSEEDFQYLNACPECSFKFSSYENLLIHFEQCFIEVIEKEAINQYKYVILIFSFTLYIF